MRTLPRFAVPVAWLLAAVLVLLFGPACATLPQVDQCQLLRTAAVVACRNGSTATAACTTATGAVSAAGCGTFIPPEPLPKTCAELKCPNDPAQPEKTACSETQDGPTCYKPFAATCPEACPAGYVCSDPAVGCVKIPEVPPAGVPLLVDEELRPKAEDPLKVQTWGFVWSALVADISAHPAEYNPEATGLAAGPWGLAVDRAYERIAVLLAGAGHEGAQSIKDDGVRSDCLFVRRGDSPEYEEVHLFEYGGGKFATGPAAVRGVYTRASAQPPVVLACPFEPCPERTWTAATLPDGWGADRIGQARWTFKAKLHTMGNADSTPVIDRDEPFCRAVGLSPYADGTPRGSCPVRGDGHPQREAVENWLLEGGPVRDSRNGQDCSPNNTSNPYAFLAGTGNCRNCNTPKTVCTEWF